MNSFAPESTYELLLAQARSFFATAENRLKIQEILKRSALELRGELLAMEDDTELLKMENQALKNRNMLLQGRLERILNREPETEVIRENRILKACNMLIMYENTELKTDMIARERRLYGFEINRVPVIYGFPGVSVEKSPEAKTA